MRRTPARSICDFYIAICNAMAEKESALDLVTTSPCEYKALKECLDRNQGKREKCEREWQEFQNACANNKK